MASVNDNYVRRALDFFAGLGDLEALVTADGRRFSYAGLRARILDTAAALWNHGVRPGARVAMLVTNAPETLFIQFGAHLIGCHTAYLPHSTPRRFLQNLLADLVPDVFVYQVDGLDELGRELASGASPPATFCIGSGGLGPDLADPPAVTGLPFDPADVTAEPFVLFPTSGTTGTPKLVRHGQRFFATIPTVAEFYRPGADSRMRFLTLARMWSAGGQSGAVCALLSGGFMVMQNGLDVGAVLAAIKTEGITSTVLAPSAFYQILDDPRLAEADVSNLRYLTLSVSPATPARLREGLRRFGSAINVVYGMSEALFITALTDLGDPAHPERLASCGRPWGDTRVEIRGSTGAVLPAGEIGEIWATTERMMDGYWTEPDPDEPTLVDGWLRTRDVGRMDADGYLYILDRIKDMVLVNTGSDRAYCRPLEDALASHPHVREAAIIGVPDEARESEIALACVVRTPGAAVTAEELRQHVGDTLGPAWTPDRVEFVDSLPLTEFGKVDKKVLRARYVARAGAAAPAG